MFDVEQSFQQTLSGQMATLDQAMSKSNQLLAAGGVLDPEAMKKLSEELGAMTDEEVKGVFVPAQEIAAVVDLVAAADAFVKLAQRQAALAQMLERFADLPTPLSRMEQMELQELAHQQHRVQDDFSQLLGKMPELLAKLPRDPAFDQFHQDVNDFLQAAGDLKIMRTWPPPHRRWICRTRAPARRWRRGRRKKWTSSSPVAMPRGRTPPRR